MTPSELRDLLESLSSEQIALVRTFLKELDIHFEMISGSEITMEIDGDRECWITAPDPTLFPKGTIHPIVQPGVMPVATGQWQTNFALFGCTTPLNLGDVSIKLPAGWRRTNRAEATTWFEANARINVIAPLDYQFVQVGEERRALAIRRGPDAMQFHCTNVVNTFGAQYLYLLAKEKKE